MDVTFYNKVNPNEILWNSSSNKRLCKFKNGICKVSDKNVINKLVALGLEYDSKEHKKYIEFLEAKNQVAVEEVVEEVKEDKKELATKEKDKKESVKEKKSTKK